MVYSEGSAPLEKPIALIISGRNKLIIHSRNKAFVKKLSMLILILLAIYGQIVRFLHNPT